MSLLLLLSKKCFKSHFILIYLLIYESLMTLEDFDSFLANHVSGCLRSGFYFKINNSITINVLEH